jgi:RNA ligase
MLDIDKLNELIEQKYISKQKHPTLDLWVLNYTQKTQFDRNWNPTTLACRGLIVDSNYNIIARSFPKFFNLEEATSQGEQLPLEDFEVTEKMDGSLGIFFNYEGQWIVATRGSFVSEQAIEAKKMLDQMNTSALDKNYTYLFEIIY